MRRPREKDDTFTLRHPGHPQGPDYDIDANGCWLWRWGVGSDNRARYWENGNMRLVSRYMIRDLLTPDKPLALHKPLICHNPRCINREHLYAGSKRDNSRDMLIDGTTVDPSSWTAGSSNGAAKLTNAQVLDIYRRAQAGSERLIDIAREYGIGKTTVSDIKRGRTWWHITST